MDNKTEEGLKRMVQDYEYETTGIPQRLDHVLMAGLERGLAQAELKERQIDIQVDTVVKVAKQVAKKSTYEELKKIFFDYEKMYNDAVKENKVKNKKGTKSKKIIKNIFGLASLGSLALGISMCFFEGDNVPAILSPFKDGGDMLFMFAFVVFGVIWWILQATISLSGDNPEYSGQARVYQSAMGTIIEEGLEKRFQDRFYKDKDFHEYNDMDIWEEDELEEQPICEKKKKKSKINKKILKMLLVSISIIILIGVILSITLNSIYPKANNSKGNIGTDSLIENNKEKDLYDFINTNDFKDNNVIDNITSQTENQSNQNKIENESTSFKNENNNIPSSNNNNDYTNDNKANTGTNNNLSSNNNNNNTTKNTTLEQIKLPNLINLTEAEAIKKLESLGLEYSITSNTKQVAFNNSNAGKSIVTKIIDKKDYYSQYDRVQLEVNQYQESGISISFIINTKELVNYVKVYVDNKEYSAYYFPNMSSETFYANGRKNINIKIVLNNYSENVEIYNKNINLYEANKTVANDGYTYIDIGSIDYK